MATCVRDSIFAVALLLLEVKSRQPHNPAGEYSVLLGTKCPAELWAERARMAAKQATRPTLDSVQTWYNLAAYWCAVGNTLNFKECASESLHRTQSTLCVCHWLIAWTGNAMQAAQQVAVSSPRLPPDEASELKQSCFWITMTCRSLLKNDAFVAPFDSALEDQLAVREEILPLPPGVNPANFARDRIMKLTEIWNVKVCLVCARLNL